MDTSQQFSLRWNNYLSHITDAFDSLRTGEDLVDVTLSCEGKKIRAHKMLLSACSSYFRELFKENPCQHPVIIFRNVKHEDLVAIIDFMYQGEVNVEQEQLSSFLATAELLSIKGLTDGSGSEKIKKDIEETALPSAPVEIDDDPEPIIAKPVVSSSQNFLPISKRPSSPHKRKRKYSTHSVPINASNFSDKKHCVLPSSSSIQDDSADDEPIEIIPVIPCMKVEKQEYVEDSYEDITDDTQTMVNPLRTCDPSVKSSASEYNSINSSSSHHDITSGEISDMEQVLMEPGTSNENLTQDSVQGLTPMLKGVIFLGDGRYGCAICGRDFIKKNSCYDHLALHMGSTECQHCGVVFSKMGNLKRHLTLKHNINVPVKKRKRSVVGKKKQ